MNQRIQGQLNKNKRKTQHTHFHIRISKKKKEIFCDIQNGGEINLSVIKRSINVKSKKTQTNVSGQKFNNISVNGGLTQWFGL